MKSPFPYFGGKRRVAPEVWRAFGDVHHYVEPFAGSLAVLLERPTTHAGPFGGAETVNDADAYLSNLWRAIAAAPEEVARHADWPVNECVPQGTMIATPEGNVPVENVRPGMVVWGERGGSIVPTVVRAIRKGEASTFVTVGPLSLTANHPVWTPDGYIDAGNLASGMSVGVILAHERDRPDMGRVCLERPALGVHPVRRCDAAETPARGAYFPSAQDGADASGLLDSRSSRARRETGVGDFGRRARGRMAGRGTYLDRNASLAGRAADESHGWWRRDTWANPLGGTATGALQANERPQVSTWEAVGDAGASSLTGRACEDSRRIDRQESLSGHSRSDSESGAGEGHDGVHPAISEGEDRGTADRGTQVEDRCHKDEPEAGLVRGDDAHLSVDHRDRARSARDGGISLPGHPQGLSLQRESLPGSPVAVYNFQTDTGNYFAAGILVHNCDLFARHLWLASEGRARIARLEDDPDFYDAKVAGWWVWGMCAWIGSGWCSGGGPWIVQDGKVVRREESTVDGVAKRQRPHLGTAGRGVNRQLPHLGDAGQGVNRQLPHLGTAGQGAVNGSDMTGGGSGAPSAPWDQSHWRAGEPLVYGYMRALQARLRRVRVCCGDWSRVVTDGALAYGATVGVFLDPPYDEEVRTHGLYSTEGGSLSADVRAWALDAAERDPRYKIALCGYAGEHDMPADWRIHAWSSSGAYLGGGGGGVNRENRHRERIWFSPSCRAAPQLGLFERGHDWAPMATAPPVPEDA